MTNRATSGGDSRVGKKEEDFLSTQISHSSPEILGVADVIANKSTTCVLTEFPLCLILSHFFLLSSYKLIILYASVNSAIK